MKVKTFVQNTQSKDFNLKFSEIKDKPGIYIPKGLENDRVVLFDIGGGLYISEGAAEILEPSSWKNVMFKKAVNETITIEFEA